jgi:hypothetical protein
MSLKAGIIHIYLKYDHKEEVHIVGDEQGLYGLWMAMGEAMVSKVGRANADVSNSIGSRYPIYVLRVDHKSNFLKQFPLK